MMYVSDVNLQNARTITKEFDQAIESLDWCVRMTVEGIKAKLNWPWYGFTEKDELVVNLGWIFNHVIDPMLAERESFDFQQVWDDTLFQEPIGGGYNSYEDLIYYRNQIVLDHSNFRLGEITIY